jgi:type 1 glutamine amidotransferase
MNRLYCVAIALGLALVAGCQSAGVPKPPAEPVPFHILVMAQTTDMHAPFVAAAKIWLADLAAREHFTLDYVENANNINDEYLSHYQLLLQLNHPPYGWGKTASDAFQKYMTEGRGGWVGLHHASLLGDFDGTHVWPWYDENLMGGIIWKNYIRTFAAGTVHVEDTSHPVMKGVPASFVIQKEEWYTYDKTPRPGVHVIASVDESSYVPDGKIKMGDHPVIWSSDKVKARNVYIFMGHSPVLFDDEAYKAILKNAILWAAGR